MVKYMEREYGERALNGDRAQLGILQAKVTELEQRLEQQRAERATTASDRRSDRGSEHQTESSVSISGKNLTHKLINDNQSSPIIFEIFLISSVKSEICSTF